MNGPIAVKDAHQVERDIRNIGAAIHAVSAQDVLLSAASPGVIALLFENHHYPSREAYLSGDY